MKTVVIFGAGVGGLTVAHELSKYPSLFKVNIYELKDEVGGLARSQRDAQGYATEYCWRVLFGFYHNVFRIMKEIPIVGNPKLNVLSNLTTYKHLNVSDEKFSYKQLLHISHYMV